ncbi:phosphotransferase enzyme family protein [Thermobifida halotolerans]|uniref:phosphotransferase enzyme family protein n=1 Tax=Thermobifida halotolerans TaxID=483545 RepID=UPI000838F7DD|nr:phosphotransferase [Thermobifida halotolerans]
MTISLISPVVIRLCERAGLPSHGLRLLHRHATGVYLIPDRSVVVRVSRASDRSRLHTAVQVARWLADHGIAVTEPLALDQPLVDNDQAATFWTYYPQYGRPTPPAHYLGTLLRRIHALGDPPLPLPRYQPLADLAHTLKASTCLSDDDRVWLLDRRNHLLSVYEQLDLHLGEGVIHGDAYPGNTLWDGDTVRLGDWDECAIGPRELDLANTVHGGRRFGRSSEAIQAFLTAYGQNILTWPGLHTLLDLRDLHTLGAYIRRADAGDQTAAAHLTHRLSTLRSGDATASWLLD